MRDRFCYWSRIGSTLFWEWQSCVYSIWPPHKHSWGGIRVDVILFCCFRRWRCKDAPKYVDLGFLLLRGASSSWWPFPHCCIHTYWGEFGAIDSHDPTAAANAATAAAAGITRERSKYMYQYSRYPILNTDLTQNWTSNKYFYFSFFHNNWKIIYDKGILLLCPRIDDS